MREKTKRRLLAEQPLRELLARELVGRLATIDADGYPYIIPVNFVFMHDRVYVHSAAVGEKYNNILNNARVGFEIDHMYSLLHGDEPCKTNLDYESVVIRGRAFVVDDAAIKTEVLDAFVAKYTPQHSGKTFPDKMLQATTVLAIDTISCTGKRNGPV